MKGRGSEAILLRIHTMLIIAVVLVVLSVAQSICIPLALAGLLTFVLAPLATRLERWSGRVASVAGVLLLVTAGTGLVGYVLSKQVIDFAANLPQYQAGIQKKVEAFRTATSGQYDRFTRAVEEITREVPGAETAPHSSDETSSGKTAAEKKEVPVSVKVVDSDSDMKNAVQTAAAHILDAFLLIGLVLLLTIFMLLNRNDVRSRILRLAGEGRINLATSAMAETGARVFRYLAMQLCINIGFGVAVAIGLYFIGLPNAPLWGALATTLRFIPYVGPWIGAALPILLALAVSDGWTMVILTASLFVVLELLTNNVAEPWLYGASTGISPLALILSAVFWAWMWGGIGLILATPLTVCLVVMGRHIPRLSFLSILLSDQDPLLPHQECYHRLLSGDLTEATKLVEREVEKGSLTSLYDEVLVPALITAENGHDLDELDRERRAVLHQGMRDLLDDLALRDAHAVLALQKRAENDVEATPRRIWCVPVRALRDELTAIMMTHILRQRGCDARELTAKLTASEMVEEVARDLPDALCISVVSPSAVVHARNLCTKLLTRFPTLPVVIGFWGNTSGHDVAQAFTQWPQVTTVTSLADAARLLSGREDVVQHPATRVAESPAHPGPSATSGIPQVPRHAGA